MRIRRTQVAMAAALGGTLVVGMAAGIAISGTSEAGPGRVPTDPDFIELAAGELMKPQDCDDLLSWYRDRGRQLVGPYGWDQYGGDVVFDEDGGDAGAAEVPRASSSDQAQGSSETGTNVQEAGVDEPDVVKTDGELLVRVVGGDMLTLWDVGGDPERVGELSLGDMETAELLLVEDRVIAIGADREQSDGSTDRYSASPTNGRMTIVDVSDPASPEAIRSTVFDTPISSARQHGDTVRLVLGTRLPDLGFVEPGFLRSERGATSRNRDIVAESSLDDWLPHATDDGGEPQRVLDCEDISLPTDEDAGLGTLAVVGFDATADDLTDPEEPAAWEGAGIATSSTITYASADALYLADPGTTWFGWGGDVEDDGVTRLFRFDLDGTATTFAAAGEVEGRVVDRWSMDEVDGMLRVAVNPSGRTGDFNSVVTFSQEGSALEEAGRVDQLGPGEEIQSVRWFDDLAVVVTFRQTDPLYVVDLADQRRPSLLGELKIPGFSAYLHPIGDDRLIGIGEHGTGAGLTGRAQAALFDISDVSRPKRLSTVAFPRDSYATAGADPRQFTWLPEQSTGLTVLDRYGSGDLVTLKVRGDRLIDRLDEVEYGSDVYQVRTVPLPDGRVLLVTDDEVTALDL